MHFLIVRADALPLKGLKCVNGSASYLPLCFLYFVLVVKQMFTMQSLILAVAAMCLIIVPETLAFMPAGGLAARSRVSLSAQPDASKAADKAAANAKGAADKAVSGAEDIAHKVGDALGEAADAFEENVMREGRMEEQSKDIHNVIKEEKKKY
jgi:hypothetical protein